MNETFTLQVALAEHAYPIRIGSGLSTDGASLREAMAGDSAVIVTNVVVAPFYLKRLEQALRSQGVRVQSLILDDGESTKNWSTLMRVFDHLLESRCDRKTTLFALGGGVIGDLTGFAAASYMRGIPFVQAPTTLLSQVDSSVGGKTGINHPLGKNMIGAFYQPRAVFADTSTLATLPQRELVAGLAEVIKYGAVLDAVFFDWIEAHLDRLLARDESALRHAIYQSCRIKADIVCQDEREVSGLRAVLNFGHTFGHAIEAGLGYGTWLHGEAMGCGMAMAADLAMRQGLISDHDRQRIHALVERCGLPVRAPDLGAARWIELMRVDKKSSGGQIRFILPHPIGASEQLPVDEAILRQTLEAFVS